ncbi:alpha-1,4-digalacturonate transport system substrate-binding protein [Microbacterium terrae]|uniref:ABC transporter substrate-binding protein n=1 Tax=Microbacterium terrae TaxID=69369 RepID=UPI0005EC1516|nr:extracellular solute-binding protein [Microbacterium terrae]MBP1076038.1 alpha-1,4-digalacturonate transport system substrate-binding protein [Microbacterium terrae]GLJ96858.1 ABC transporter substrate-binding protein [Microbacterium terrae]
MRYTRLATAVTAVAALTALAGCSSSSAGDGPATLEFVISGDQNGAYQALADRYFEETGVTVEIVDVPYDDLTTRLRNGAQAGDLPALARTAGLDPLWEDAAMELGDIAEAHDIMDELIVEGPEGQVLTLPSDLTAVGLYINKSLFDEAGVSYPTDESDIWTWDEYLAALTEVVENTDAQYGMVMDGSVHRLRSMLYQFGSNGDYYQEDGEFVMGEGTEEALQTFSDINDDKMMPRSVWLSGDDASALFQSGRIAAYYSGVWQISSFNESITAFDWLPVYMPYETERATNIGTNWIVGFEGTGVEEETQDFIDWMYTAENYAQLSADASFLPVIEGLEVPYEQNAEYLDLYNHEIAAANELSFLQTRSMVEFAYDGVALDSEPLTTEIPAFLNGEQSLDDTITAVESGMDALVNG